jgi:hypothetical protein
MKISGAKLNIKFEFFEPEFNPVNVQKYSFMAKLGKLIKYIFFFLLHAGEIFPAWHPCLNFWHSIQIDIPGWCVLLLKIQQSHWTYIIILS